MTKAASSSPDGYEALEAVLDQVATFIEASPKGQVLVRSFLDARASEVLDRLRARTSKPVHELRLLPAMSPRDLVRHATDFLAEVPEGAAVLVTDWARAFPMREERAEAFGALNLYREQLFRRSLVQVWWMSEGLAAEFQRRAPDSYSWFTLALRVRPELSPSSESRASLSEARSEPLADPGAARRTSAWLERQAREALELGPEVTDERIPRAVSFAAEALLALLDAGLVAEAWEALSRFDEAFVRAMGSGMAAAALRLARRSAESEISGLENALADVARAMAELGAAQGDVTTLEVAVECRRILASRADRATGAQLWAKRQGLMGNALQDLGERTGDPATLAEAVAAYRSALEVFTRASSPSDWAMTQNNLGAALGVLGERSGNPTTLAEAVAAYRSALEVYVRATSPSDWAMTQNNLGIALQTLGERSGDPATLAEAVAAYRSALEVFTLEAAPHQHVLVQRNLGRAQEALRALEFSPEQS